MVVAPVFSAGHPVDCASDVREPLPPVLTATEKADSSIYEVDIMGYNSNQSDTDDHSSIQSMTSDGGMAISTKRLCLVEEHTV
ncbi:hypothetical protein HPB50_013672 [Hyalomma asiaticum]|uniref:Uncharacterized protein n=1 Tax=Hyalomma asiaticum TaxID=266040 RepID=A0ACB7TKA9_HYAAI|nr:hypothetical protein HPB50_013672 [Hyalomma asiaticum]